MIRAALVAVALVAAVWGGLHVGWYPHRQIVDYGVYQFYGDAVVSHHAVPYRDFQLEYPPAALPMFATGVAGLGFMGWLRCQQKVKKQA